jgi:hypothetical protein
MAGRGQQPPAAQPRHLTPLPPGVRGRSAAAAVLPPLPFYSDSSQHSSLPATILHEMFNTCVARGIAAKLVQKTVDGKVEVSLHCSTMTPAAAAASAAASAASAAAAAASVTPKRKRKRPDNERRRTRRKAWRQRCSAAAAAAKSASGLAAAAVTTDPGQMQPAAMPAATPPQAWALEKRDGLVLMARRLPTKPLESPEVTRNSEGCVDLNVSTSSWAEERELAEDNGAMVSPITYAAAAAKGAAAAREDWSEEVEKQELADPEEAKQCPVCLSRNRQPEKDRFSKLIRCNFCYTVH